MRPWCATSSGASVVLLAMILVGCGGSVSDTTASSGGEAAALPGGIGAVTWPTDPQVAGLLVAALPESLDGVSSEGVREDDSGTYPSVSKHYPDGRLEPPGMYVWGPVESPLRDVVGSLVWAGCPDHCLDLQASPSVTAAVERLSSPEGGFPSGEASPSEQVWASFTVAYGIDSGRSFDPDERSHCVVWASGDLIYTVCGRNDDQRDRLVAAAAAGIGSAS